MKYLFTVVPIALATLRASAQVVVGVHFTPAGQVGTPQASGSSSVSEAASVSGAAATESGSTSTSSDMSAMPTQPPSSSSVDNNSYGYTDVMPYSSLTQNGYQQMACGYGYARQSPMGYCEQQSWVCSFYLLNDMISHSLLSSIKWEAVTRPLSSTGLCLSIDCPGPFSHDSL